MRKIIFLVLLLLSLATVNAQLNRTMSAGTYSDTLKSTKKVFNITPDYYIDFSFTIAARTVSGIDTIYVKTTARDTSVNTSKTLIDLSTSAPVSYIIATTTPKEYFIYDPTVYRMTLTTINGLVNTLFTVSRK